MNDTENNPQKTASCKICFCNYDLDEHKPHVLDSCGHSFCVWCIGQLSPRVCPFDKTTFLSSYPNFDLLDVISPAIEKAKLVDANVKNFEQLKTKLAEVFLNQENKIEQEILSVKKEIEELAINRINQINQEKTDLNAELDELRERATVNFSHFDVDFKNEIEANFTEQNKLYPKKLKDDLDDYKKKIDEIIGLSSVITAKKLSFVDKLVFCPPASHVDAPTQSNVEASTSTLTNSEASSSTLTNLEASSSTLTNLDEEAKVEEVSDAEINSLRNELISKNLWKLEPHASLVRYIKKFFKLNWKINIDDDLKKRFKLSERVYKLTKEGSFDFYSKKDKWEMLVKETKSINC